MLGGMSDLCMYEFEETAWGEFCRSDDHIVPHPSLGHSNVHSTLGSGHKKPRCEVTKSTNNTGDRSRHEEHIKDESGSPTMNKRSTVLGKAPLPQTPTGVYPSPPDSESIKEASSAASDNDRSLCPGFKSNNADSNGSESCDTALNDKTGAVDNSSFNYTLGDATQTGNTLDFLGNAEEKDTNEFMYYGWPEIGNFEDVDKMFRSCDSTFGFGASREDDLGWFSSAVGTPGSGDVLDSNCRFPSPLSKMPQNIAENQESSKSYSINDVSMASGPISFKDGSWASEDSDPYVSFVNGPDITGDGDKVIPKEQTSDPKKQPVLHNQPMGKAEQYFRDGSCNHDGYLSSDVLQQSPVTTAYQASPSVCMHQEQLASSSDYAHKQNAIAYAHTDNRLLFKSPSVNSLLCAVKSETNGLSSLSPRDSSCGSSQLTAVAGVGRRQMMRKSNVSQTSKDSALKNASMTMQQSICDSGLEEKRAHSFENHNDVEGIRLVVPAELGSSNVPESSTMSSGLHDSSLEAVSFRQLQHVTEQLDLRTKLCIRDSLYRLARSAEQRHATLNGTLMGEGSNTFIDMETDTNPIDRSIAHLLFHRPSESSAYPVQDSLLLDSPVVQQVHGSSAQETASKMEIADG